MSVLQVPVGVSEAFRVFFLETETLGAPPSPTKKEASSQRAKVSQLSSFIGLEYDKRKTVYVKVMAEVPTFYTEVVRRSLETLAASLTREGVESLWIDFTKSAGFASFGIVPPSLAKLESMIQVTPTTPNSPVFRVPIGLNRERPLPTGATHSLAVKLLLIDSSEGTVFVHSSSNGSYWFCPQALFQAGTDKVAHDVALRLLAQFGVSEPEGRESLICVGEVEFTHKGTGPAIAKIYAYLEPGLSKGGTAFTATAPRATWTHHTKLRKGANVDGLMVTEELCVATSATQGAGMRVLAHNKKMVVYTTVPAAASKLLAKDAK